MAEFLKPAKQLGPNAHAQIRTVDLNTPIIPFQIPQEFIAAWQSGTLEQVGALLKNVDTGKIVGHLQETGALEHGASALLGGPAGVAVSMTFQAASMFQNHQMGRQLTAIEESLGAMHSLQLLTAVSSVVGIGVTVASTAIILSKMKAIEGALSGIEQKVDRLPSQWRELNLSKTLEKIETQLERLEEVPVRKDARPVLQKVEEELHSGFNDIHSGIRQVVAEAEIDPDLLQTLLAALAVSGSAQFKALLEMDDTEAALQRARTQSAKMQSLAFEMPRDLLARRINGEPELASQISGHAAQIRLVMASKPSLTENLIARDLSGLRYLRVLEEEKENPLLVLPSI